MPEIIPDDTDYSSYVTCELSQTMDEFIEWLHEFVPYAKLDDRSAFLGARLYGYFQRSESHQNAIADRTAAKQAEQEPVEEKPATRRSRSKVAATPEPEPAPATKLKAPARRGKLAAAPEPEPEPAAARPVRRRGRPVSSGEAAPY
jgi:hypothetical protein